MRKAQFLNYFISYYYHRTGGLRPELSGRLPTSTAGASQAEGAPCLISTTRRGLPVGRSRRYEADERRRTLERLRDGLDPHPLCTEHPRPPSCTPISSARTARYGIRVPWNRERLSGTAPSAAASMRSMLAEPAHPTSDRTLAVTAAYGGEYHDLLPGQRGKPKDSTAWCWRRTVRYTIQGPPVRPRRITAKREADQTR